jgi:predicted metal-binding membrane protein
MGASTLEAILRRDRAIIIAAVGLVAILAWADLAWISNGMVMDGMAMNGMDMTGYYRMIPAGHAPTMPASSPWQPLEFACVFVMWVVMMIGMMVPSAMPTILVHARAAHQKAAQGRPLAATAWFAGGYLLAWTTFSFAATLGQWALERASPLTPIMAASSRVFGATVLIAAGLCQWTPLKAVCACRNAKHQSLLFCAMEACAALRALVLGLRQGSYCVGCRWALMLLLFVLGVMNLLWIAVLAILVMLEKILPFGRAVARVTGLFFVALGGWMLQPI